MRVRLKGLNMRRKRLADGREVVYYYAWKGGPRLEGKPGSPEFLASYNAAVTQRRDAPVATMQSLLDKFQDSGEWRKLAPRTQADYVKKIASIEIAFGDFPLRALADRRTRGTFLEWRDELARVSTRQADYAWTVLACVLSWAKGRQLISINPCERGGRLYSGTRAEKIWSHADEAAFHAAAPKWMILPLVLALWTGQRQGDLLRLQWGAYDGSTIRLQQGKTGVRVLIPVGAPLRAALDAASRRSPFILVNKGGKPWTESGFRSSWDKAIKKAGISDVTFNDLRGTAVTRLALAEATEAEIATITGHTLRDVRSILDAHYLSRDPALAQSAIRKLERHTATRDGS